MSNTKNYRPVAVPLVTVDPFFSIWSNSDHLYDSYTKHWTGRPFPMYIGVKCGNRNYTACGADQNFTPLHWRMVQKSLEIKPLNTVYVFENDFLTLTLDFTSALLPERLDILSRPVSYIEYKIEKKDGCPDDVQFMFGISSECCVNNHKQNVVFKKTDYSLMCGNAEQNILNASGDDHVCDWGYLHLCDADAFVSEVITQTYYAPLKALDADKCYNAYSEKPYLAVVKNELSGVITLAYDEVKPIEYFKVQLDEYYTKFFPSFGDMVKAAVAEYPEIKKMCDKFGKKLMKDCKDFGEDYQKIAALSFRQAIAAHKMVADTDGEIIFLSKECFSNGCIGTLDVTYPSIPLFLKYNPELVLGMLRPIVKYARSDAWEFDFVPHDVGQYPLANGQVYGQNKLEMQMPVEESGNMLLCVAAVAKYYKGGKKFFEDNKDLMKRWADYLVEFGYDPGNQLCTDDFAGHLAHNCNLSVKAILGIAGYAALSGDDSYMEVAEAYAAKWELEAKANHEGTRLVFDNPDGWSLKYNMVWDNILGYNIFSKEVKKNEIKVYMSKMNRYGVPLDSRKDYTKIDWLMWSTCIYDSKKYFNAVVKSIINMINEAEDRVPLTDWYDTKDNRHFHFQNRTVVGGLFINLLD